MEDQLAFLRGYLGPRSNLWTRIATEAQVARRAIAYIANNPERDPQYSTVLALMRWVRMNDPAALVDCLATGPTTRTPATRQSGQATAGA